MMNRHGGIREEGVLDYSVNINPLGMPDWLEEEALRLLQESHTYPPILAQEALLALGTHLQEPKERLIIGNGATELLYLFARSHEPGRVLLIEPTFNEYRRAFSLGGWEVGSFLRSPIHWRIDLEALFSKLEQERPKVVVLCEPNNPTSTMLGEQEVDTLIQFCEKRNILLFLDESFLDFARECLPSHRTGVVRLRSMTKFYAIAGLRLGYLLADEAVIKKMLAYKEPWTVNTIAQGILPKLLSDRGYRSQSISMVNNERSRLLLGLRELGLDPPKPEANFLFFHCPKGDFHQKMYERGFYLRSCEDFAGLGGEYYRICVRTGEENQALLAAMKEVLE